VIDDILRKAKVFVNVVHEFDNIETLKRSVEVGAGVSILPESTVSQEVRNKTLACLQLSEGPFYRPTGIVLRKGRNLPRAVQEFVRWLS
jgi:DNA-binding transcriptional LysR family regulator